MKTAHDLTHGEALSLLADFTDNDPDAPAYRRTIHTRDGEGAATNGFVHVRISAPAIRATDGAEARILDFRPEPAPMIAAGEWLSGNFADDVRIAWEMRRQKLTKEQEDFDAGLWELEDHCPHCGKQVIVSDGELYAREKYIAEKRPRPDGLDCDALILAPGCDPTRFSLYYLWLGIQLAQKLGGPTDLCLLSGKHLVLSGGPGSGWFFTLAARGWTSLPVDLVVRVPDEKDPAK